MKILVTGGTVFVSRLIAEYFVRKGCDVFVLNRNTRCQPDGVHLIEGDRHNLGEKLRAYQFDAVIDTGYNAADVAQLSDALGSYGEYVFISSSAVYPECGAQPFREDSPTGENSFWGKYGTDKIEAERTLIAKNPRAYIVRPPYLYGPLNNVYREAFVFDCALADRKFYLPQDGSMKLQFFHVRDLCRFIEILLEKTPVRHIFNVGNLETVSVREWAELCYAAAGKRAEFVNVGADIAQRNYFCFYNYEYRLDVSPQREFLPETTPLSDGLCESFEWYVRNQNLVASKQIPVNKKPYFDFIDRNLAQK